MTTAPRRDDSPCRDESASQRAPQGTLYLESAVRMASPAKLRLMLIERAAEVAGALSTAWRDGREPGANELSLKLLDLLTELLAGVRGGATETENRLCGRVADLYVFLTQHLIEAEGSCDAAKIDEIRLVLVSEALTWRNVCAAELGRRSESDHAAGAPSRVDFRG